MVNYIKNEALEKHQTILFGAFALAIIFTGIIYIYGVSAIMMQTVGRNDNLQKLQAVEQEYRELEKDYLSLISKFNLDYAHSLGFISNGNATAFIARETPVAQNSAGYAQ